MTRTMYDSDVAADIPADAAMVAGYVDIWSAQDWARFPNAIKVRIARNAGEDGDVLDVESGDATPDQAPAWVTRQRERGAVPCVYMSESAWPAVRAAFVAARPTVPDPLYWVAAYQLPNDRSIPAGAVAHQYASPAYGSGGHWDLSSVVDYWPGVDPAPDPPLHKETDVATGSNITVVRGGNRDDYYYRSGGDVWHEWPGQDANGNPVIGKEQINKDASGNAVQVASELDGYYLSDIAFTFIKARTPDGKTFTAKQADAGNAWEVDVA